MENTLVVDCNNLSLSLILLEAFEQQITHNSVNICIKNLELKPSAAGGEDQANFIVHMERLLKSGKVFALRLDSISGQTALLGIWLNTIINQQKPMELTIVDTPLPETINLKILAFINSKSSLVKVNLDGNPQVEMNVIFPSETPLMIERVLRERNILNTIDYGFDVYPLSQADFVPFRQRNTDKSMILPENNLFSQNNTRSTKSSKKKGFFDNFTAIRDPLNSLNDSSKAEKIKVLSLINNSQSLDTSTSPARQAEQQSAQYRFYSGVASKLNVYPNDLSISTNPLDKPWGAGFPKGT